MDHSTRNDKDPAPSPGPLRQGTSGIAQRGRGHGEYEAGRRADAGDAAGAGRHDPRATAATWVMETPGRYSVGNVTMLPRPKGGARLDGDPLPLYLPDSSNECKVLKFFRRTHPGLETAQGECVPDRSGPESSR